MNELTEACKAKALDLGRDLGMRFTVWTSEEVPNAICLRFEPADVPYTQPERNRLSALLMSLKTTFESVDVHSWHSDGGAYAALHKRAKQPTEA